MVDPDAPSSQNPNVSQILHWLQPNVTFSPSASYTATFGTTVVPYAPPAPPLGSGFHRYILLLFSQPANFVIPQAFQAYNATNRAKFNATTFASIGGLGAPVEANYFRTQNTTATASATSSATASTTAPIATFTGGGSRSGFSWPVLGLLAWSAVVFT